MFFIWMKQIRGSSNIIKITEDNQFLTNFDKEDIEKLTLWAFLKAGYIASRQKYVVHMLYHLLTMRLTALETCLQNKNKRT